MMKLHRKLFHKTGEPVALCPEIDLDLLLWLENTFPPKCYEALPSQTLEDHLKYAGAVGLITMLRNERDVQGEDAYEDALAANMRRDIPLT